jgi:hypothetical protein
MRHDTGVDRQRERARGGADASIALGIRLALVSEAAILRADEAAAVTIRRIAQLAGRAFFAVATAHLARVTRGDG